MKKKYSTIKLVSLFVGSILTVSCNDSFLDRYVIPLRKSRRKIHLRRQMT